MDGEILYNKGKDQVLLKYEGICRMHANEHKMLKKIMRARYYWMTLENDYIQFARKCHKCQIYADKIHVFPTELHVMTIPWPFSI